MMGRIIIYNLNSELILSETVKCNVQADGAAEIFVVPKMKGNALLFLELAAGDQVIELGADLLRWSVKQQLAINNNQREIPP